MGSYAHGRLHLAVECHGSGPLHTLAFHGFGRDAGEFSTLLGPLAQLLTVHAFDLPWHGRSAAPQPPGPISKVEWAEFFRAYMANAGVSKCAVLGYSLGGRMALCLLEKMPELIEHGVLLAPDGLVPRPWYRALANYSWGRWLYAHFVDRPAGVHALFSLLKRVRLLDPRMYYFLMEGTGTTEARALLHQVWSGFSALEPDLGIVARNADRYKTSIELFMGQADRVIPPAKAKRLLSLAPDRVHLHVLPGGHQLLGPLLGEKIAIALRP